MRVLLLLLIFSLVLQGCGRKTVVFKPQKCSYTYRVKGKTYCVRKSSSGYVEVGIASWYGPGFHGKRTASGEFYNMYKLTAAHKTLPLGTYVKVINLENGKSVVVKINDRGPFVPGRIIDLSYAAAKRIGMLKKGTAKVKLIALGKRVDHHYRQENYERGRFYVQVGAFKNKLNAYRFRYKIQKKLGVRTKVVRLEGYYRVLAGPVFSYSAAKVYRKKLKKLGLKGSFILRY
ncbi:MAG: septal ring lytic transglycosylase RlpA family lipoprotein [Desulfurobacterium sp.]|nr:MAG: septal ring lytic transglycosylase RlpA family lipoprotein [Desulfurobacterium sp.]